MLLGVTAFLVCIVLAAALTFSAFSTRPEIRPVERGGIKCPQCHEHMICYGKDSYDNPVHFFCPVCQIDARRSWYFSSRETHEMFEIDWSKEDAA